MTYRKSVIVGGQVLVLWALLWSIVPAHCLAETLATCGAGWLERVDGQLVLHVKGTPYEMGYQHGALLKQHCTENSVQNEMNTCAD